MPATNKSLQLFLFSKRTIVGCQQEYAVIGDRKSTRLNSSPRLHLVCRLLLEKKKKEPELVVQAYPRGFEDEPYLWGGHAIAIDALQSLMNARRFPCHILPDGMSDSTDRAIL